MAKKSKPEWVSQLITPEFANGVLESMGITLAGKSAFDQNMIEALAADMAGGHYAVTGDTLLFDRDNKVIDGIKRLLACSISGASFPGIIVRNVDPEIAVSLDQQRKRRGSDVLHVAGQDNARELSSMASLVADLARTGKPMSRVLHAASVSRFLAENPDILTAFTDVKDMPLTKVVNSASIAGATLHMARITDAEKAAIFFDALNKALETGKVAGRQPHALLAKRLIELRNDDQVKGSAGNRGRYYRLAIIIKAWNHFLTESPLSKLDWHRDQNEAFPAFYTAPDVYAKFFERGADKRKSDKTKAARKYEAAIASGQISISVEKITPKQAEKYLEHNGPMIEEEARNRKRSPAFVERYARDMTNGKWILNFQPIKFSATGRLLDGQHRLAACALSGVPFITMVVRGLPDDAFSAYDLGKRRSFAQILSARAVKYPSFVQAATRLVWQFETYGLNAGVYPTTMELVDTFDKHPAIEGSSTIAMRRNLVSLINRGTTTGLHYILGRLDSEKAALFFEGFETGEDLKKGSPILTLRNKLMNERDTTQRSKLGSRARTILVCRAWDAFTKGKDLKSLSVMDGFPEFFSVGNDLPSSRRTESEAGSQTLDTGIPLEAPVTEKPAKSTKKLAVQEVVQSGAIDTATVGENLDVPPLKPAARKRWTSLKSTDA